MNIVHSSLNKCAADNALEATETPPLADTDITVRSNWVLVQ